MYRFRVGIFSKHAPIIVEPPPAVTDQDRLDLATAELREASADLARAGKNVAAYLETHHDGRTSVVNGEMYHLVGAMNVDPELQRLESVRDRAMRHHHQSLAKWAQAKEAVNGGRL